jgi:protoporphyrinogen oxidase
LKNVGIVGSGPSGLSLGYFLGGDYQIYETDREVGGHARSIKLGPYTFDRGPHIIFSRDKRILDFMLSFLKENVHDCIRNNKVWVGNQLLNYPIENDLGKLETTLIEDIVTSLHEAALNPQHEDNLDVWFRNHFGSVLTELYFKPYNEKIWKTPLAELSMSWSDRIPKPPFRDIIAGTLGVSRHGYTHQLYYQYPLLGGFQALSESIASQLTVPVKFKTKIDKISISEQGVLVSSKSQTFIHDLLIWTGHLDNLIKVCDFELPDEIVDDIKSLRVNPMSCITLAFTSDAPPQYSAIYVPGNETVFNRISFPTVFSPNNSPKGEFLVQAEVTYLPNEDLHSDQELQGDLVRLLVNMGIISKGHTPTFKFVEHYEKAYVVYEVGYEKRIERVKSFFKSKSIILHGRFGAFNYINTDMCIFESAKLAASLRSINDFYTLLK